MATSLDAATDIAFWSQSGYRPGHKLDPNDPQDAAMIPVWRDIRAKLQRADKLTGTAVDHPAVAQHIADAHAADQAAAASLDAAAQAPDQATAQKHVADAAAAAQASKQKTQAAAALQPPLISPQLSKDAAQQAAANPPPPDAPAHKHVAHAQALAVHTPTPQGVLLKEADSRWWTQGYKPGQKLDPSNPADAKMIPLWKGIFARVKAEDADGKLILTYNNPVVMQHLADAQIADKMAATSLDAAAATPDPAEQQQHIATAQAATEIVATKTQEAAKLQPPSVSPSDAHRAAQAAAADPPHPSAPARDQLAHEQAKAIGHKAAQAHQHHDRHRRQKPVKSSVHPGKVQDYRAGATRYAHQAGKPFVLVTQRPDGTSEQQTFASRAELDAAYAQISDLHDQYAYVAEFDLGANPNGPLLDSVGISAADHIEQHGHDGRGGDDRHHGGHHGDHRGEHRHRGDRQRGEYGLGQGSSDGAGSADAGAAAGSGSDAGSGAGSGSGAADSGGTYADPAPQAGWSTGQKIAAAILTAAAVGTLTYMATHKKSKPAPRRRASPKVLVAPPGALVKV